MLYLTLRLFNSFLTFSWGFVVTAVLVRVFGLTEYGRYIIIAAVGMYLSASDLGISNYVYARVREGFVRADYGDLRSGAVTAISIYFGVAFAATVAVCIVLSLTLSPGQTGTIAPLLFFAASAAYLPWTILRVLCNATDMFVQFEIIDLVRRIIHLTAIGMLLVWPSMLTATIVLNVAWVFAFAFALFALKSTLHFRMRTLFHVGRDDFLSFIASFRDGIGPSIVFSIAELFTYSFGYIFVPFAWPGAGALVIYDLFYKFQRAAIVGNQVASTGLQPQLTRAYHAADGRRVRRMLAAILLLSLVAMTALSLFVLFGGRWLWPLLLHDSAKQVTSLTVLSIVVASYGNAIQNTAGTFIINVGKIGEARSLAVLILALVAIVSLVVWIAGWGVDHFLIAFAIVYVAGAFAWSIRAWQHVLHLDATAHA